MMESTGDEIDRASNLEAYYREQALARMQRGAPPADFDGESCYECGGHIHPKRLELGYWNCIECVELQERHNKFFKR